MRSKLLWFLLALVWTLPADAKRPVSRAELHAAAPGDVLRLSPLPGGAPNGIRAYQLLYRSIGFTGQPILVSAAMFYADVADPPPSRPVVAWAHPTTGVTRNCSPSRHTDVFNRIPALEQLLAAGYVVVATDYAGFASVEPHPYLVGDSHARSVLDSVRAVRQLKNARASNRFIVWGHSQGAHAALFTGEVQPTYAPELELAGVAAAAPPTYLADIFRSDAGTVWGNALTAMALNAWSSVYGIPDATVVDPAVLPAYRQLARNCIDSLTGIMRILEDERRLRERFFIRDPTTMPEWRGIMNENSPGKRPIVAPVLIAQGRADDIVPYAITRRFAADACRGGTRIQFFEMATGHIYAAENSARPTLDWMRDRFRGRPLRAWC